MVFNSEGQIVTNRTATCEHEHDYKWLKWLGVGLFLSGLICLLVGIVPDLVICCTVLRQL